MRVKCPNSDIVLELPGDKTDMKFTCPACHKIHRVTVTISTPGETPAPAANPVARNVPAMPKKYATGAFAPVVDVPIDANFVLIDGSVASQGIDLGAPATPPPPPPRPPPVRESAPESARFSAAASSSASSSDTAGGDGDIDTGGADEPAFASDRRPENGENTGGGILKGVLFLVLLAVLCGAGYLGHQQYSRNSARRLIGDFLSRAENAWRAGDIPAASAAVREAKTVLDDEERLLTPRRAYNRFAEAVGVIAPLGEETDPFAPLVGAFTAREEKLDAFVRDLDDSGAAAMADRLRAAAASSGGEFPGDVMEQPVPAMERAVVAAAVKALDADAANLAPEQARARAQADRAALAPVLSDASRQVLENELSGFIDRQNRRMADDVAAETAAIVRDADSGAPQALSRYRALAERLRAAAAPGLRIPAAPVAADDGAEAALEQLAELSGIVDEADAFAQSAFSREDEDDSFLDELTERTGKFDLPNPAMAAAAADLVDDARATADELLSLRIEVVNRLQSGMQRNRQYNGTLLAWAMLRVGFGNPGVLIDPAKFFHDAGRSEMHFSVDGVPASMAMAEDDYEQRVRASMNGYNFVAGWSFSFNRPVAWMAALARGMKNAGVDPAVYPDWEVIEGPEGPLALSVPGMPGVGSTEANASLSGGSDAGAGAARAMFFGGQLLPVAGLPRPENVDRIVEDFRLAAQRLEEAVMADGNISQQLRQALQPVLKGTYEKPDPRDYFDSAFCRRLIEADYLESYIRPMPDEIRFRLAAYRDALRQLESGYDEFSVALGDGRVLYAGVRPDGQSADAPGISMGAGDQDPETGEALPRYAWRVGTDAETVFYSPQPARFFYSLMLAEHYDGRHTQRPAGVPALTEVRHATRGVLASYRNGADSAEGSVELWNEAAAGDTAGRMDPTSGPPGWNYPLHVLQRDDQGDPVRLATLSGVVDSPDFSGILDEAARRQAEDEWLDSTARTLSAPGELGLIFHQFFRYCSDSPLPELPNVIGSHVGLSDTHQTVYESLERRWVGRLIGDCDDLAEFFQVLTRRQGKLSHVMQLPGHAAAGYAERTDDGAHRFVVLQTGPVMQFVAPTLNEAVEYAYRSFDRGDGMSHMTTDAVPLLLRFANEETRTPFVLSARIFEDAEYADTMITVQSYWHEHVYSAAIAAMEALVAEDRDIGNIKELGSLYERVGFYDKSETLRRQELGMVRNDPQASLSTLLEIVQLHFQDRNRGKALAALGEMEEIMLRMIRDNDAPEFFRNMTFRSYWAMFLSRLGQPARAWELVRQDVRWTKQTLGRVSEPVIRTLVSLYERMAMARDRDGGGASPDASIAEKSAMEEVRAELEQAFQRGYFSDDDAYNSIIGKYFFVGRFAVSDAGRARGLDLLLRDGPYASSPKDQTKRARGISDEDWSWFRIVPQLYYSLGAEMLDQVEYPEFYNPGGARTLLEDVKRALERGTGLGSDIVGADNTVTAQLTLAFLNNDLAAFRRAMAVVLEKDYSSLYDDAALTFGAYCGLVPLADFPAWAAAFHEFFPGRQHYFKVVYRAIDKEHYDHALVMAEATARFFPENAMLSRELEFVRSIVPDLKNRKIMREWTRSAEPGA